MTGVLSVTGQAVRRKLLLYQYRSVRRLNVEVLADSLSIRIVIRRQVPRSLPEEDEDLRPRSHSDVELDARQIGERDPPPFHLSLCFAAFCFGG